MEVTISALDSRKVRDPSAPRAIRNKQQASPTQSALSRPLKNCSKKPDSALLRNLVSNADGAVVGLRRRHLYGTTQRRALSGTVQVAGPGGGRGGVGE